MKNKIILTALCAVLTNLSFASSSNTSVQAAGNGAIANSLLITPDTTCAQYNPGLTNLHIFCAEKETNLKVITEFFAKNNPQIINQKDTKDSGYTPVHMAILHHNWEMLMKLIEQGADLTIKSNRGETSEELAQAIGQGVIFDIVYSIAKTNKPFEEKIDELHTLNNPTSHKPVPYLGRDASKDLSNLWDN